jgi:hypothetical protein
MIYVVYFLVVVLLILFISGHNNPDQCLVDYLFECSLEQTK